MTRRTRQQLATAVTCTSACGGAGGQQVCCRADTNQPLRTPRGCATATDCTPGNQCLETCAGRGGERTCCQAAGAQPEEVAVTCATAGAPCGKLRDRYEVTRSVRACGAPVAGRPGLTTSCSQGPNPEVSNPAPAGYSCRTDCSGLAGSSNCCADAAPHGAWLDDDCQLGVGVAGGRFPRGDFVRAGSNPRVLHFEKRQFCARATDPADGKEKCACTIPGGPASCAPAAADVATRDALVAAFKENVAVGTCGSKQEQGLEAARLAIKKALGVDGLSQPADVGGAAPEWPHPRRVVAAPEKPTSKLVVVFVGDEDDCSSPESASAGIIVNNSGNDACAVDGDKRRFPVQGYRDFLTSLGRPVAGAFIVDATGSPCATPAECQALCGASTCPESCVDGGCVADLQRGSCCDGQCTGSTLVCSAAGLCGGQGPGVRFVELSGLLKEGRAADTVVGSVCSPGEGPIAPVPAPPTPVTSFQRPGFSSILARVAEVVKQPAGLSLPTQPAAAELTLLRIAGADGKTRKTCTGPAAAASPPPVTPAEISAAVAAAEASGADWWFTGGDDTNRAPTGPTKFITLNRTTRNCEANPGETYSADYLGLVPATGCETSADCQAWGGRNIEDWRCCAGFDAAGQCLAPSAVTRGSCLCVAP